MSENNPHNEHSHFETEAMARVSQSVLARNTEVRALVQKVLTSTQVETPQHLAKRQELIKKLDALVKTYDTAAYDSHIKDLKKMLQGISARALQEHEKAYVGAKNDKADIARDQRIDIYLHVSRSRTAAESTTTEACEKIIPLRDALIQSMINVGSTEELLTTSDNAAAMSVSHNLMEILRTFYDSSVLAARAQVLFSYQMAQLSRKDPQGKDFDAWNKLFLDLQLVKEHPFSYLQKVRPQLVEQLPLAFPDQFISPQFILQWNKGREKQLDPRWATLYQGAIQREENRIAFNKGFSKGAAESVQEMGQFFISALTFLPKLSYEMGVAGSQIVPISSSGNIYENAQTAFQKLLEEDDVFAQNMRDSYILANTISKTYADSVTAYFLEEPAKEQFLQDMSEDKLVDFCVSYLHWEKIHQIIESLPPETKGQFVGNFAAQLAVGAVSSLGSARILSKLPALESILTSKSFSHALETKVRAGYDKTRTLIQAPEWSKLPPDQRRQRMLQMQRGHANFATAPRILPSQTSPLTPPPLYRNIKKVPFSERTPLTSLMESLTQSAFSAPSISPEILSSGSRLLDLCPKHLHKEMLLPGSRAGSFAQFMENLEDPDRFVKFITMRPERGQSVIQQFANSLGKRKEKDVAAVQNEVMLYIEFIKQQRVQMWINDLRPQHFERMWYAEKRFPQPTADKIKLIEEVSAGKVNELFFAQLLEEFYYTPLKAPSIGQKPLSPRVFLGSNKDDAMGVDIYAAGEGKFFAIDLTSDSLVKKAAASERHEDDPYKFDNFIDFLGFAEKNTTRGPAPIADKTGQAFKAEKGDGRIEKKVVYLDPKLWNIFREELANLLHRGQYYKADTMHLNTREINQAFEKAKKALGRSDPKSPVLRMTLQEYMHSLLQ